MQKSINSFFKAQPEQNKRPREETVPTTDDKKEEVKEGNQTVEVDANKKRKVVQDWRDWKEKAPQQVKNLCQLEFSTIDDSWLNVLYPEFEKPYFIELKKKLFQDKEARQKIYPPENEIYSWTRYCPFENVKVVILGQDPYHQPGQAHGLAFSVKKGVTPPPSLRNIYKELESDIKGFQKPKHGNLEAWSRQGVLLLNATLTVKESNANSHSAYGWERFTERVIQLLNERKNVVFILWGAFAQKKAKFLTPAKHLIIKGVHPSPLSASNGFFGSKPFSKTNQYLKEHNLTPIDWSAICE